MKKSVIAALLSILIIGCNGNSKKEINSNIHKKESQTITKTDWKSLDLSKNQIFIDSTRSWKYYSELEANNNNLSNERISELTKEFIKDESPKTNVDNHHLNELWVSLRNYNGEFLIYDACDAKDPVFGFHNSYFYFLGGHEPTTKALNEVSVNAKGEMQFSLISDKSQSNKAPIHGKLENTEHKNIKKLILNNGDNKTEYFVVPISKIRDYDVLVNHCPTDRVEELDKLFAN
jgi:hypothetical protein